MTKLKFLQKVLLPFLASTCLFSQAMADGTPALADDLALEKQLSAAYLEKMVAEPEARVIEKGIVLKAIFEKPCSPEAPCLFAKPSDTVYVAYHLVDREGKVVDESITSDELADFPLYKLIQCWQIALPKISVGSFYKVSCPSDVVYGDKGAGDVIKPGAALTFRLTVYDIGSF